MEKIIFLVRVLEDLSFDPIAFSSKSEAQSYVVYMEKENSAIYYSIDTIVLDRSIWWED